MKTLQLFFFKLPAAAVIVMYASASFAQDFSCEKMLLSYASFKEEANQKWHLELKRKDSTIFYYFGVVHSKDSNDEQFTRIREQWKQVKPTIALFEGPNRGTLPTATETISKMGESGYVRFLAKEESVATATLEPAPADEINYLNTLFPSGQVKLFFALREAWQVRERSKMAKTEIEQYISKMLVKANQFPHMQDTLTTLPQIEAAFQYYWGTTIEWWQAPADWFTPGKVAAETGGIFTNEINRASSEFRNLYMYQLISKLLKEGRRIFAVVGRNHIPMQTDALSCEWEQIQRLEK